MQGHLLRSLGCYGEKYYGVGKMASVRCSSLQRRNLSRGQVQTNKLRMRQQIAIAYMAESVISRIVNYIIIKNGIHCIQQA